MKNPTTPTAAPTLGAPALGGKRRCGTGRTEGGIYLECGPVIGGAPLEEFMFDPTIPLPAGMADTLTKIGMTAMRGAVHGVTDLLDWVGETHYPYATDFMEEARFKGFSRKIAPSFDFSQLQPGSRMIFVHARGAVTNHEEYAAHLPPAWACPCGKGHAPGQECIGLLYRAAPAEASTGKPDTRYALPDAAVYAVGPHTPGEPNPAYAPAMFAWAYITNIAVIKDANGKADPKKVAAASASGLPVTPSGT